GLQVGGVVGCGGEQCERDDERNAETDGAIAKEAGKPSSLEPLPKEEAGEKEHERHEKYVVEGDEGKSGGPAHVVDDGNGEPGSGWDEQSAGRRRSIGYPGECRVMRDHKQD